ncbi:hypothetical protein ECIV_ORF5 [European chub iridovirus]|nr:hypothetical protein ECIV_ORF5 [European chub iridovirus]
MTYRVILSLNKEHMMSNKTIEFFLFQKCKDIMCHIISIMNCFAKIITCTRCMRLMSECKICTNCHWFCCAKCASLDNKHVYVTFDAYNNLYDVSYKLIQEAIDNTSKHALEVAETLDRMAQIVYSSLTTL